MLDGIHNAVIKSTTLDIGERGCLIAWIDLDYGGSCQSFGGTVLYKEPKDTHNFCGYFISSALESVGVSRWEKLPGTPVRVSLEDGLVRGIGHYLKDEWFYSSELQSLRKNDYA